MALTNYIVFVCDDCKAHLNTETGDFNDAKECSKNSGWGYIHPKENYCPDCYASRKPSR